MAPAFLCHPTMGGGDLSPLLLPSTVSPRLPSQLLTLCQALGQPNTLSNLQMVLGLEVSRKWGPMGT